MLKSALLTFFDCLTILRGWIAQLNSFLGIPEPLLYCLLFGLAGMGLFFLVHPVIRYLARRGSEAVISWACALTLLLGLLLIVEISRLMTDGSSISPPELLFALGGFLALFALYLLLCGVVHIVRRLTRRRKK